MRYESYLDPILGYPGRFRGSGVGYRYASYAKENFEVTLGNFYEQFGSGLLLRAYEERQLGIDNALDGFRLMAMPGGRGDPQGPRRQAAPRLRLRPDQQRRHHARLRR